MSARHVKPCAKLYQSTPILDLFTFMSQSYSSVDWQTISTRPPEVIGSHPSFTPMLILYPPAVAISSSRPCSTSSLSPLVAQPHIHVSSICGCLFVLYRLLFHPCRKVQSPLSWCTLAFPALEWLTVSGSGFSTTCRLLHICEFSG